MTLEEAIQTQGFASQRDKALIHLLYSAYQAKAAISTVLKDFALTPEQYNVLRILHGSHPAPLCNRDIATRTIERNSNTPRIIDRLEIKKLVKRFTSPEDRRETLVSLTPAGINLLRAASSALEAAHPGIMPLTEEEALELNNILQKTLPQ